MKDSINYDHYDYIVIRVDKDDEGTNLDSDVCVMSFDTNKHAKEWMEKDYQNVLENCGGGLIEKIIENDYAYINDNLFVVEWQIRKIHHRTEGTWTDPNYSISWKKKR